MSYDDTPHYEREIFLKTRLDVLLKPIVGKLSGKNAPQIKLNNTTERAGVDEAPMNATPQLIVADIDIGDDNDQRATSTKGLTDSGQDMRPFCGQRASWVR
jgi:hypothetical protein